MPSTLYIQISHEIKMIYFKYHEFKPTQTNKLQLYIYIYKDIYITYCIYIVYIIYIYIYNARETTVSFSRRPEKMVFPKKLLQNMIFLVLSGEMTFLFLENMILRLRRKIKDDISHGDIIFSSGPLKIWPFQKELRRHMVFLVLSGKTMCPPPTRGVP